MQMLEFILLWLQENHPKVIPPPPNKAGFTGFKAALHGLNSVIAAVSNIRIVAYEGTGNGLAGLADRLLWLGCTVHSRWVVNIGPTPHPKLSLNRPMPGLSILSKNEVGSMGRSKGGAGGNLPCGEVVCTGLAL